MANIHFLKPHRISVFSFSEKQKELLILQTTIHLIENKVPDRIILGRSEPYTGKASFVLSDKSSQET